MSEFDEVMAHYGVKGMKWGKRKGDSGPMDVVVSVRPGKKIKTSGGRNQSASDDAITAAVGKQFAKKSGVQSLSNKELKIVVERMNLEQQYSRLASSNPGAVQAGAKFAKTILVNTGQQQAKNYANTQIADILKK